MSRGNRGLILFGSIIGLLWLCTKLAYAAKEFDIESTSTYSIEPSGTTNVTHDITFKNLLPYVYATDYALSIGSTKLTNVWAKDGLGGLEPKTQSTLNSTTISVSFREKSVGLGQTLKFSIGYNDNDIAQKIGRVWEVNIPRPEDVNEFATYTVVLLVPSSFGLPVQITPQPNEQSVGEKYSLFRFTKDGLTKRGVTAIFGDKQVFSFDLRYTLENPTPFTKTTAIALPPNTSYQTVLYDDLSPQPVDLTIDEDGNWIASYEIPGNYSVEIHAKGNAIIYLTPQNTGAYAGLPVDEYLKPQPPWQVDDPALKELSQKLKTPENIYAYIVDNLSYNYERVQEDAERLGAKAALADTSQAICMEFTDLFITLARAAGIPARELNGFAFTKNPTLRPLSLRQDILHAWPEYYDREKLLWIPVDPTWENTTQGIDYFSRFDLNHFVFVIHGVHSDRPLPVGFYKGEKTQGKDIIITPKEETPIPAPKIKLHLEPEADFISGLNNKRTLLIINAGNTAVRGEEVILESDGFAILTQSTWQEKILLPYTTRREPLTIAGSTIFRRSTGTLRARLGNSTDEAQIVFKPITSDLPRYTLYLVLGATLAASTANARRVLLSLREGRSALRRQGEKPPAQD